MENIYKYPILDALQSKEKWDVPEDYFEELPSRILAKVGIMDLVGNDKPIEPVKEAYFDTFFSRLQNRIEAEEEHLSTPLLDSIPKDSIWQVPQGYFDDFSNKVLETAEEKAIAPLLYSLEKRDYEVPENYFETLPARILAKAQGNSTGKVIQFNSNWLSQVRNYGMAVAASVAIILGGIWLMPQEPVIQEIEVVPNFSHISTEELQEAIEAEDIDDEMFAEVMPVSYTSGTSEDLPQVDDISEEELLKYLEKEGEL